MDARTGVVPAPGPVDARARAEVVDPRAALRPHVPRLLLQPGAVSGAPIIIDGSLLLLDITGFTALSERLAARGRRGAEEVTDLVNACFSAFLDVAWDDDGSLLKFGGDSLLLLFEGEGHASRAARAALRMRSRLGDFARPRRGVGEVALGATMGVAAGTVTCLVVGSTHRELVVTGAVADRCAALESAAEAGQILVDDAVAAHARRRCTRRLRPGASLLVAEPDAPLLPGPTHVDPDADPAPFVSAGLREHLAARRVDAEHRQAVVAFVHVGEITDHLEAHGAAATARALDDVVGTMQAAAAAEGVCVQYSDVAPGGAKLLLLAGVPVATDHDEEAMLRTLRRVTTADLPLPLRVGVNRGRVFCGEVGTHFRRTFAVMGDVVNVAARLMARADVGTVLATPAVVDRSRAVLETTPVEPLPLKGKALPVAALRVGEPTGARRPTIDPALPLAGRDRELGELRRALAGAIAGRGRFVEIVAEPGLGKSRLVLELRRTAAELSAVATPVTILDIRCEPYGVATPYHAVRDTLRDLLGVVPARTPAITAARLVERLGEVAPELVPVASLLADALALDIDVTDHLTALDPQQRRARLHEAVHLLLGRLLPDATLVCIDDGQWMDEASAELLLAVARRLPTHPWLVCLARRPSARGLTLPPDVGGETLLLGPLPESAAVELVAAAGVVGEADRATLASRAQGNPFFICELVRAARDGLAAEDLPESVEGVVATRLDQLATADRSLLRHAAVVGASFSDDLLRAALDEGDRALVDDPGLWHRLEGFVDAEAEGGRRFRHALFREVAYEGLAYARRRLLHARVAHAYRERSGANPDEVGELLSLHYHHGGVLDQAWAWSVRAARRAAAKGASVEALRLYRRALENATAAGIDAGEVTRVRSELGEVCVVAARYAEAERFFRSGLRRAESPLERAEAMTRLGRLREIEGRGRLAARWHRRALDELDRADGHAGGPDAVRVRLAALAGTAGAYNYLGRFREAAAFGERAVTVAEAHGDRAALARAYFLLHLVHTHAGNRERSRYRHLALPLVEELGDLVRMSDLLNNLGIDAYYEGDWARALDYYGRSHEMRARTLHVIGALMNSNNIAEILSDQGHLAAARADFERVLRDALAYDHRLLVGVARSNLGRVHLRRGDLALGAAALEAAAADLEELSASGFLLETRARQVEHALLSAQWETALAGAEAVLAASRRVEVAGLPAWVERLRAAALARLGREDEAGAALARSLHLAESAGVRFEAALARHAIAVLGLPGAAAAEREATLAFRALGVVTPPPLVPEELPLPAP